MNKNYYKNYQTILLGWSDVAALILVGCEIDGGLKSEILEMGGDGYYDAYYVDSNAEIGDHYEHITTFDSWMKIFDDDGKVFDDRGRFNIYRAGSYGIIIQKITRRFRVDYTVEKKDLEDGSISTSKQHCFCYTEKEANGVCEQLKEHTYLDCVFTYKDFNITEVDFDETKKYPIQLHNH